MAAFFVGPYPTMSFLLPLGRSMRCRSGYFVLGVLDCSHSLAMLLRAQGMKLIFVSDGTGIGFNIQIDGYYALKVVGVSEVLSN